MSIRLPAKARRQQLLDTSLTTFARLGYHDSSMNDIADSAGVTKPVLYQHFESKRELFLQLLISLSDDLRATIRAAIEGASTPRQQVEFGISAYFRWAGANRDGFVVLFDSEVRRDPEFGEEAKRVHRELVDSIAELIVVPGLDRERQRLLAFGIVGLNEKTCSRWLEKEIDLDAEELAAQVAGLAWSGLRGLHPA
ncbi:MAG: TetR/AcrR family transcriptional regulator [Acidobacteria bacterium]|nr:TetR/AcrR family transcriptional regulator [Acidobacteriota bacterium]